METNELYLDPLALFANWYDISERYRAVRGSPASDVADAGDGHDDDEEDNVRGTRYDVRTRQMLKMRENMVRLRILRRGCLRLICRPYRIVAVNGW